MWSYPLRRLQRHWFHPSTTGANPAPGWIRHPTAISTACRGLGVKCVGHPARLATYSFDRSRPPSTCVVAIADGSPEHLCQTALVSILECPSSVMRRLEANIDSTFANTRRRRIPFPVSFNITPSPRVPWCSYSRRRFVIM